MGFLHWVFGKHPVKPAMPPDPNKVAVAGRVPLSLGPMVIALLDERGIRASYAEMSLPDRGSVRLPTTWPQAIIYVMEPNQSAASRFIDEFLSTSVVDEQAFDDDFERHFGDGSDQ